jgi:hypothetical protein
MASPLQRRHTPANRPATIALRSTGAAIAAPVLGAPVAALVAIHMTQVPRRTRNDKPAAPSTRDLTGVHRRPPRLTNPLVLPAVAPLSGRTFHDNPQTGRSTVHLAHTDTTNAVTKCGMVMTSGFARTTYQAHDALLSS